MCRIMCLTIGLRFDQINKLPSCGVLTSYKNRISFWTNPSILFRYVVVKKSEHMPYFDERFFNYGYNKIQYIDHLKYIGYV